jgi:hypothetical protein
MSNNLGAQKVIRTKVVSYEFSRDIGADFSSFHGRQWVIGAERGAMKSPYTQCEHYSGIIM